MLQCWKAIGRKDRITGLRFQGLGIVRYQDQRARRWFTGHDSSKGSIGAMWLMPCGGFAVPNGAGLNHFGFGGTEDLDQLEAH